MSDDGRHALTLIAFVGSVFSPYYFRARARGVADAHDHCAMNVALYGARRASRWAFTEYPRESLHVAADTFSIGRNVLDWNRSVLTLCVDETTAPWPGKIRGVVRLHPQALADFEADLDDEGLHHWHPIAPRGRVEVEFTEPALRWRGNGYFDSNTGSIPLEDTFSEWTWSRADLQEGAAVLYEVLQRNGRARSLALQFTAAGAAQLFASPPIARLPGTHWRIARHTRADDAKSTLIATLEDAPFYARSLLQSKLLGQTVQAVHESLSLDRFRSAWVRALLPFRMRRS